MSRRAGAILFVSLLMLLAHDAFARCAPWRRHMSKPVTITLDAQARGVRDAPAYYWRDSGDVTIFMKPEDVLAALGVSSSEPGAKPTRELAAGEAALLAAIDADLPLTADTDLKKYAIGNNKITFETEFLVSDLLRDGHVAIDYSPLNVAGVKNPDDPPDATTIVMVSEGKDDELSRYFCDRNDRRLFMVVYIWVD